MTDDQSKKSDMAGDENAEQEEPEVEGQRKKFFEPAKDVEGQGFRGSRSDAESPDERMEEKGDESREPPEVEGQSKRFFEPDK